MGHIISAIVFHVQGSKVCFLNPIRYVKNLWKIAWTTNFHLLRRTKDRQAEEKIGKKCPIYWIEQSWNGCRLKFLAHPSSHCPSVRANEFKFVKEDRKEIKRKKNQNCQMKIKEKFNQLDSSLIGQKCVKIKSVETNNTSQRYTRVLKEKFWHCNQMFETWFCIFLTCKS